MIQYKTIMDAIDYDMIPWLISWFDQELALCIMLLVWSFDIQEDYIFHIDCCSLPPISVALL